MKKYILAIAVVAAFVAYIVFNNRNAQTVVPAPSSNGTAGMPPPSSTGTGMMGTGMMSRGQYKDGTYTGPVTDAFYGKLQVVVIVSGGKIISTNCPIFPNDRGETTLVSNRALPLLKQETIAAQSANVNIVSGATQTSEAFQQSLTAALAQAKA